MVNMIKVLQSERKYHKFWSMRTDDRSSEDIKEYVSQQPVPDIFWWSHGSHMNKNQ